MEPKVMEDSFEVECVVDIRTMPRSRTNPQYYIDLIPDSLSRCGITYRQLPKLGTESQPGFGTRAICLSSSLAMRPSQSMSSSN
ncbi:TPA: DUF488 family protein [Pseudomonas putida]|nr:DUF488 family protein [Pseudomonas putida]